MVLKRLGERDIFDREAFTAGFSLRGPDGKGSNKQDHDHPNRVRAEDFHDPQSADGASIRQFGTFAQ